MRRSPSGCLLSGPPLLYCLKISRKASACFSTTLRMDPRTCGFIKTVDESVAFTVKNRTPPYILAFESACHVMTYLIPRQELQLEAHARLQTSRGQWSVRTREIVSMRSMSWQYSRPSFDAVLMSREGR